MMDRDDFQVRLQQVSEQTRQKIEAHYQEHFIGREDVGLDYTLDDHLWQAYKSQMLNIPLSEISEAGNLPASYFAMLRQALNLS